MQPVLILQFMPDDGAGYLGSWARREGVPLTVRHATSGEPFPPDIGGCSALAVLGGAMSVNDDLPYLRDAERLILQAMAAQIPVLGHCLGGQLMAHALGARVQASPAPEIGWQRIGVRDVPEARSWFGATREQHVFHWHYESFALPPGAVLLAESAACPNQAFAIGAHLAMQFHVEIDAGKISDWLAGAEPAYADALRQGTGSVHSPQQIRQDTDARLAAQQALADRIYARWLSTTGGFSR
ncbi:MAG: type 1 glutamine amidotransferase [Burkholderiaceae bacterium]